MQSDFVKLVKHLKKKYKWTQRDIAFQLYTGESTISNCLHGNQGNTGDKFVPRLKGLIKTLEHQNSRQNSKPIEPVENVNNPVYAKLDEDMEYLEQYSNNSVQSFIPTYKYSTVFCCPMCSTQQRANVDRACIQCGFSYNLG